MWPDFGSLSEGQRVFYIDPEIADPILDVGVTERDLHGAQVAGRFLDDRRFGAAQ